MTTTENRTLGYGIAGSLAVHLLLFLLLAMWLQFPALRPVLPPEPELEKQVTLLFPESIKVEPAPVPPPVLKKQEQERYIRTTQNEDAKVAPTKSDFISDRNTVASAKMAADPNGESPLPTMNGVGVPTLELANRELKDGKIKEDSATAAAPRPAAAPPSPPTVPKAVPLEMRSPEPELDLKRPTKKKGDAPPDPLQKDQPEMAKEGGEHLPFELKKAVTEADRPPEPKTSPIKAIPVAASAVGLPKPDKEAFVPQTRTAKAKGTISNRGEEDAVNAAASPTGRYMRSVTSAIEKKWHINRRLRADFVEPGKMRLHFYVNRDGKPEDLKIVFAEANAVMTDFTLSSILEADIPPIPKDLLPILDKERFEIEYDVVIY